MELREEIKLKISGGMVFYTPKYNQLFQIRGYDDRYKGYKCSGFCNYFSDAQTTITIQYLDKKFIKDCVRCCSVNNMDGILEYDGIGWGVIKEVKDGN